MGVDWPYTGSTRKQLDLPSEAPQAVQSEGSVAR